MKNLALYLACILVLSACKEDEQTADDAVLKLSFSHVVGEEPLQLNTARYVNAAGEAYSLSKVRYYISNIRLRNTTTGEVYIEPDSYHLVGTESSDVFEISLEKLPIGTYNQLEFAIGVDNSTNTSTDRVGALDPSNDMAWNWNTGYKFLSVEGTYFVTEEENEGLIYHIGGDPNYRKLTYTLGQENLPEVVLSAGNETQVSVRVDVAELFDAPNLVSFKEHAVVMFDPFSEKVADNYASGMFTIERIE